MSHAAWAKERLVVVGDQFLTGLFHLDEPAGDGLGYIQLHQAWKPVLLLC